MRDGVWDFVQECDDVWECEKDGGDAVRVAVERLGVQEGVKDTLSVRVNRMVRWWLEYGPLADDRPSGLTFLSGSWRYEMQQ